MTTVMDNGRMNLHREGARELVRALNERLCVAIPTVLTGEVFLWQNDRVPECDDGFADYTEADFQDYAGVEIDSGGAGCAGIIQVGDDSLGKPTIFLDQQTWVMGTPGTTNLVYGVGVWVSPDAGTTKYLLATRRFTNAPAPMVADGDTIKSSGSISLDCILEALAVEES